LQPAAKLTLCAKLHQAAAEALVHRRLNQRPTFLAPLNANVPTFFPHVDMHTSVRH
jgi:hypothetical protein